MMTDAHFLQIVEAHQRRIRDRLAYARPEWDLATLADPAPSYNPHEPPRRFEQPRGCEQFLEHCLWMLGELPAQLQAGKREKAMRWLGWIQGVLCLTGVYSLEALKRANMPPEAVFDPQRV